MNPDPEIERAVAALHRGGVIAYPTEAVWGLGCDPSSETAVRRLLELKQRPVSKGLILVAGDIAQLAGLVDWSSLPHDRCAEVHGSWPGPHTWIVPATTRVPHWITGDHITDTALLGGMTDGIYFRKVDASASIAAVTEKNSTETEAAEVGTLVANTTIILEFYFDGATVYFFVNGVQVAAHTANIPDDEALTPSIEFLTGEAVAHRMKVAWGRAFAIG